MSKIKRKIIKIYIDEESFPELFNQTKQTKIKTEDLGNIYYNIFECGYNTLFPDLSITNYNENNENNENKINENIKILNNMNLHTDSIKYDIQNVKNKLDKIDIDDKLNKFSDIIEDLLGITSNSSKKGKISEDIIYKILRSKFKDYTFEETRGVAHHGDGIVSIPSSDSCNSSNNKNKNNHRLTKVMIEIKNYNKSVDSDEVQKLKNDMIHTGINFSLFLSLKSGFVGKKRMYIEEFKHNDNIYYIVYIPNIMTEISKIEAGMALIERLIDYNKMRYKDTVEIDWLQNNISQHLRELDKLYKDFSILSNKYHKMEKNVKRCMSEYYIELRGYESELKDNINTIWKRINTDFGLAKKELLVLDRMDELIKFIGKTGINNLNKIFISSLELLKKNGYYAIIAYGLPGSLPHGSPHSSIPSLSIKIPGMFNIFKGSDNELIGNIIRNKKNIQIIFNNPSMTITIENNKDKNNNLNILSSILELKQ